MKNKTRVVSIRLNPRDGNERQALEVLDGWKERGYEPRQIITSALNHHGGKEPSMFRPKHDTLNAAVIEDIVKMTVGELLEEQALHIIREIISDIKSGMIEAAHGESHHESAVTGTGDTPSAYEQKLIQGMMQRRRLSSE